MTVYLQALALALIFGCVPGYYAFRMNPTMPARGFIVYAAWAVVLFLLQAFWIWSASFC